MTVAEVLNAAADLIERCGLHEGEEWPGADRGEDWTPGDPCCVLGAIALITGKLPDDRLTTSLRTAVGTAVSTWSDEHSQAEVVAALRAVATS